MKKMVFIAMALLALTQCGEGPEGRAEKKTAEEAVVPSMELAQEYAMQTQAALGGALQKQIAERGASGAIGFCNLRALSITDSLATARGATIRRVTDRPRNPANQASGTETELMEQMRTALAAGDQPKGMELPDGAMSNYYFPIVTSNLCLKCHGMPGADIPEEVLARLRETYPRDQATGYGAGQLRGLWKVTFSKNR